MADEPDEFEKMMAHLLNDLGEMDVPGCDLHSESGVISCEINLMGGVKIKWIDRGSPEKYLDRLSEMITSSPVIHISDSEGIRHLVRTARVIHVKIKELPTDGQESYS